MKSRTRGLQKFLVWIGLGLGILAVTGVIGFVVIMLVAPPKEMGELFLPACPANPEGLLTSMLIDPEDIAALTPLGNVNPPGHTSPVDHIYFQAPIDKIGKEIAVYHPADGWLDQINVDTKLNESTGKYEQTGFALFYTLCNNIKIVNAGPTRLTAELQAAIEAQQNPDCKTGQSKPGHGTMGVCYYPVHIKVKSGDLAGWATGNFSQTIEVWAYDYNRTPDARVDWSYYTDENYSHAMCLFDLYAGALRDQYYAKFGIYQMKQTAGMKKDPSNMAALGPDDFAFTPRTIEPRCGQVVQDLPGTLQGMWFSGPKPKEALDNPEFSGMGLAFLHYNVNPQYGVISIGGNFMPNADVWIFLPAHTGRINREFSETSADGGIYCYEAAVGNGGKAGSSGKILVQLLEARHLQVEYQAGTCGDAEKFIQPYSYER